MAVRFTSEAIEDIKSLDDNLVRKIHSKLEMAEKSSEYLMHNSQQLQLHTTEKIFNFRIDRRYRTIYTRSGEDIIILGIFDHARDDWHSMKFMREFLSDSDT